MPQDVLGLEFEPQHSQNEETEVSIHFKTQLFIPFLVIFPSIPTILSLQKEKHYLTF